MSVPYYYRSLDFEKLVRDYPPSQDYAETVFVHDPKQIEDVQNRRFLDRLGRAESLLPEEVGRARCAASGHSLQGRLGEAAHGCRRGLQGQHQGPSAVRGAPRPHPRRRRSGTDQAPVERRLDRHAEADPVHAARMGDSGDSGLAGAVDPGRSPRRRDADSVDAVDREPRLVLLLELPALVGHRTGDDGQREPPLGQPWPITQRRPTTTRPCRTALSSMRLSSPTRMGSKSPRRTAPNQRLARRPTVTRPTTYVPSATNADR